MNSVSSSEKWGISDGEGGARQYLTRFLLTAALPTGQSCFALTLSHGLNNERARNKNGSVTLNTTEQQV